ncbi:uncharacterized protein LOC133483797 isoform X1 [Phyllopteryx taeniolatus]|uniref:uncharacterized protein LOC133483797 isoform X1 n=1 Tax=Phyllopteryx taeniolatus TaxID=161469 RepID=UPI002AD29EA6|nr:uncharacterized protein LOC133483797 isoform X1 [Phyllopteryx taeniolatus]XP_061641523.1 uncharacterized protein LOC133483797 isoform X1 [Phyllopteryx taeniolatus]
MIPPEQEMEGEVRTWAESLVVTLDELECKICYNRYDARGRKPKLLACLHRVCAKCLKRMVDVGESSPSAVSCPFCRHQTLVPEEEVTRPPVFFFFSCAATPMNAAFLLLFRAVGGVADGGRPSHPGGSVVSGPSSARRRPTRRSSAQSRLADRCRACASSFRAPGDHHRGAAGPVAVFGLSERAERAHVVPGLAGPRASRPQVRLLDVPPFPPLPAGGAVSGVLQLSPRGHLPADDGAHVAGRGSGQPGPVHAASAGGLRLLPLSVPRAPGGARRSLPGRRRRSHRVRRRRLGRVRRDLERADEHLAGASRSAANQRRTETSHDMGKKKKLISKFWLYCKYKMRTKY